MEPFGAASDHALAFSGQVPKIRCEDRRGHDRLRHDITEMTNHNSSLLWLA